MFRDVVHQDGCSQALDFGQTCQCIYSGSCFTGYWLSGQRLDEPLLIPLIDSLRAMCFSSRLVVQSGQRVGQSIGSMHERPRSDCLDL